MNRPTFRDPVARDAAWGRYYARQGAGRVIRRGSGFRGCKAPTNAERVSAWAARYALIRYGSDPDHARGPASRNRAD